jgi:hypothetical protein
MNQFMRDNWRNSRKAFRHPSSPRWCPGGSKSFSRIQLPPFDIRRFPCMFWLADSSCS